jgi:cytochrome P450
LYNLSEHPDVQIRLREEIHRHLGKSFDPNNPPTADEILKLKYLDNVCREVLRINPPGTTLNFVLANSAPLTVRQAITDDVFEGVRIPRGALIHMPMVVSNLNPAFWGPDAEEFRPERWDNLKDVPNTSFLTFLHGNPHERS